MSMPQIRYAFREDQQHATYHIVAASGSSSYVHSKELLNELIDMYQDRGTEYIVYKLDHVHRNA
jgi:hypothetical protein